MTTTGRGSCPGRPRTSPAHSRGKAAPPRSARPRLVPGVAAATFLVAGCGGGSYVYDWSIFSDSVLRPDGLILTGIWLTLSISVVSQLFGTILGVLGALGRTARLLPFRLIAGFYVWFFRGTPLLVQLTFFFYGLSVARIWTWPPVQLLGITIPGEIQAGVFALSINEGAYMSEIVRAGILAIDRGQMEAARSLGMTQGQAMRRIILPQAARVIVPPLGNEFNNMLKTTSLLVILGNVPELYVTFSRKNGSGPTSFHPFELFLAAAVWYLLLTTIWSLVQAWIERRLGQSERGDTGPGAWERLVAGRAVDHLGVGRGR